MLSANFLQCTFLLLIRFLKCKKRFENQITTEFFFISTNCTKTTGVLCKLISHSTTVFVWNYTQGTTVLYLGMVTKKGRL